MRRFYIGFLIALLCLVSCSSARTKITQNSSGEYTMVATSNSPQNAYEGAIDDATKYCTSLGKTFGMVKHRSQYVGPDADALLATETTRTVAGALLGYKSPQRSSMEDFRETVVFECK